MRRGEFIRRLRQKKYRGDSPKDVLERYAYRLFKQHASQNRNRVRLTFENYKSLIYLNCEYCGKPPSNELRRYDSEKLKKAVLRYQGFDRKDSRKGYTKDNIVPCCKECNRMKSDLLSYEEMKIVTNTVQNIRSSKEEPQKFQRLGAQAQLTRLVTTLQQKIKNPR